ncbi:hypothetical protein KLMIMM109B2_10500 [Klebsiella michiganensis]
MISIFALGSDLPEIEVIRSALSEKQTEAVECCITISFELIV